MTKARPLCRPAIYCLVFTWVSIASHARGNDPDADAYRSSTVEENRLREVRTDAEFQRALHEDRAALFISGKWSVFSRRSQRVVDEWVSKRQPPLFVFLVDPDEQPYVRRWLDQQSLDHAPVTYQKGGGVIWLRRGHVVANIYSAASGGEEQLRRVTERAVRAEPQRMR